MSKLNLFVFFLVLHSFCFSQTTKSINWSNDGKGYFTLSKGDILYQVPGELESVVVLKGNTLLPIGSSIPLLIKGFQ